MFRLLPRSGEDYLNPLFVLQAMPELLVNQNSTLCQALEDINISVDYGKAWWW